MRRAAHGSGHSRLRLEEPPRPAQNRGWRIQMRSSSNSPDPPNPTHALPKDEQLLAAIGRIALTQGQLDNALRMAIKDLADVTKEQALDATARPGSGELR